MVKKYLSLIIFGSVVILGSTVLMFQHNSHKNEIASLNGKLSELTNKITTVASIKKQKVEEVITNESGVNFEKVASDNKLIESFLKEVFNWKSYKEYTIARANVMKKYNIDAKSNFMTIFMPEVANRQADGKDYNRIDLEGFNLSYEGLRPYVTKIGLNEYSYFVEVTVVSRAENKGEAKANAVVELSVGNDGLIKNIEAWIVGD